MLNISAEDAGVPKMAAYQELRVSVENVNDNAPQFELAAYQGSVNESNRAGLSVATVRATDNDKGGGHVANRALLTSLLHLVTLDVIIRTAAAASPSSFSAQAKEICYLEVRGYNGTDYCSW